jgi:hypothetical protein
LARSQRDHNIRFARSTFADAAEELIELNEALKIQSPEFNSKLKTDSMSAGLRGRMNKKLTNPHRVTQRSNHEKQHHHSDSLRRVRQLGL